MNGVRQISLKTLSLIMLFGVLSIGSLCLASDAAPSQVVDAQSDELIASAQAERKPDAVVEDLADPILPPFLIWFVAALAIAGIAGWHFRTPLLAILGETPSEAPTHGPQVDILAPRATHHPNAPALPQSAQGEGVLVVMNEQLTSRGKQLVLVDTAPQIGLTNLPESSILLSPGFRFVVSTKNIAGVIAPWTDNSVLNKSWKPEKVYIVHERSNRKWYLVRTDSLGYLAHFLAELNEGTVIRGDLLKQGGPNDHFKLQLNGSWLPSLDETHLEVTIISRSILSGVRRTG